MSRLVIFLLSALSLTAELVPGRYILELSDTPGLGRGTLVAAQQRRVRTALTARALRVRASVDTVANALIVDAPDAAALAALPGVRKVHAVRILDKALDRALALMKIPEAWQRLGGPSNAGAGAKIGIIDTGIDPYHAGFQDASLTVPEGFPKFSSDANRPLTNNKVIVARSYDQASALDLDGHGTAVAMIAAGARHAAPNGATISGVAPKAFLGAYRASEADTSRFTTDNILRAMDDAVKDGMDVINMSLGAPGLALSEEEIITVAINRAAAAGVLVITAAGNSGPDPLTVSDTGAALNAISVGSTPNDRAPATPSLIVPALSAAYPALPASNSGDAEPLQGSLIDLAIIDSNGLGCTRLAAGALAGKIVLLQRGECTFEDKFANADAAGAAAIVVYNNQDDPMRIVMEVGRARLKGLFLSRGDGAALKRQLAGGAGREPESQLSFRSFRPDNPDRMSTYSSRGPSLDLAIKPDLVAVGGNIITAGNGTEPGRPETSGYIIGSGTSLSAPAVAGAAAAVKAARPGLSPAQYRSLIINSSTRFPASGQEFAVQQSGAGMLNLQGALSSTLAVSPVSVSFGEYKGQAVEKEITVSNLGRTAETYSVTVFSANSAKPQVPVTNFTVNPLQSSTIKVQLNLPGGTPGEYQGLIEIAGGAGSTMRVPYWAGVRAKEASQVSLTLAPSRGAAGGMVQILFRAIDAAGFFFDPKVEIAPVSGGGEVTNVLKLGAEYPGLYYAELRLGSVTGMNVFRISAGGVEREFRIAGER